MLKSFHKLEFITHFYKESKTPIVFEEISYFGNRFQCSTINSKDPLVPSKTLYSIRLVPEYFGIKLQKESYKTAKIKQYNWGYSIQLTDIKTADAYLKKQFNSNARKVIRRNIKRLETCFNVKYEMYYGNIALEKYEALMTALHDMLVTRFDQRGEVSKDLLQWEQLRNNTYDQILNGKASLFAIYRENDPIEISLNYHFDKILFSSVSSYDIDYSKFGLGHIEIYKQLEWCLENGYVLFEMGVGGMDYKQRWSNNIYQFEHHILYDLNDLSKFFAAYEIWRVRLKEYLKSKKVNDFVYKIGAFFRSKRTNNNKKPSYEQQFWHSPEDDNLRLDTPISRLDNKYSFLKKPVHDFLYLNQEHENDITIFTTTNPQIFVLKGKTKSVKIRFDEL